MYIYLRTTYSLTTNCLLTYFKTNNSGVEGGGGVSGGGDDDDHTHRDKSITWCGLMIIAGLSQPVHLQIVT